MISPLEWLEAANLMRPKLPQTTEWFSGLTKPTQPGWYERHFTDSPIIGDASMQWWDGKQWYAHPRNILPHWRQVGEYPAWRGLSAPPKSRANRKEVHEMAGKRAYVACTACVWKGRRVKGKCNCRDENEPSCLCSWGICPRCSAKVDTAKTVGRTVMFCGVGICDKDEIENFEAPQIRRLYAVWRHMLIRSTPEYAEKFPGYAGCSIDPEFVKLSGFIKWALKQVGSCTTGFQIDKDILVLGNKRYGPDVCAFVPPCINSLFLMQSWTKSGYPQGVKLDKQKFVASCHVEGGRKYIGTFESCELAFAAYKQAKEHEIKRVADMWRDQIDPRVYQALVEYKVTPRNQEKSA